MTPLWEDSEQVLHAKQALTAYEAARAEGRIATAAQHLAVAEDSIQRAHYAVLHELECQRCPQPRR